MEVLTAEATEWLLGIRPPRRNASRQPLGNSEYWMDIFAPTNFAHKFECEFHEVWQHADYTSEYSRWDLLDPSSVAAHFRRNQSVRTGSPPVAGIQIANIKRATPEALLAVCKSSEINLPALLLLLKSPWYHFQYFPSCDDRGHRTTTFCLSRDDTRMGWVYDHSTHFTRAVLLQGNAQSPQLTVNFERFRKDILHPLALVYFHEYRVIQEFEESCHWTKSELRDLENTTGHKFFPPGRSMDEEEPAQLDLAELSRKTSALNLQILRISSWARDAETLCNDVKALALDLESASHPSVGPTKEEWESSINWQAKRIEALRQQAVFLKARIDIQNNVIFNLISQEDARQGIVLSRSSTEIAESAKADSSSMQTIAVMTMIFLPGTFFAALFAMPLLRWDQDIVLQERFWVYWAFTIPSTVVVLIVWSFVQHSWLSLRGDRQRKHRGQSRPKIGVFTSRRYASDE